MGQPRFYSGIPDRGSGGGEALGTCYKTFIVIAVVGIANQQIKVESNFSGVILLTPGSQVLPYCAYASQEERWKTNFGKADGIH